MNAPAYADQHAALLRMAQQILADRETAYPHLVAQGKLTQAAADDGLRIARAIAADWQRIVGLREGRDAAPEDDTATDAEKHATLAGANDRVGKQLARAVADVRTALAGSPHLANAQAGLVSRDEISDAWTHKRRPWSDPTVGVMLAAERRAWLTEALLWHATRPGKAMLYAELQAELIARDRRAEAA